jgi:hypothetical protein
VRRLPPRFFEQRYHEALELPALAYEDLRPALGDHGAALLAVALFKSIIGQPPRFGGG